MYFVCWIAWTTTLLSYNHRCSPILFIGTIEPIQRKHAKQKNTIYLLTQKKKTTQPEIELRIKTNSEANTNQKQKCFFWILCFALSGTFALASSIDSSDNCVLVFNHWVANTISNLFSASKVRKQFCKPLIFNYSCSASLFYLCFMNCPMLATDNDCVYLAVTFWHRWPSVPQTANQIGKQLERNKDTSGIFIFKIGVLDKRIFSWFFNWNSQNNSSHTQRFISNA